MSLVAQRVQLGPFFSGGTLQGAAKLYHYAAGTSTLKNLWTDRTMLTTVAQPLVADSSGVFNFFADGLYKLLVCGPNSTGPSSEVLYTLDNWQLLDAQSDILWSEGAAITSASSMALGSEVWNHITGSTAIATITMTTPFAWLVFDGNLTLTYSANLLTPAGIDLAVRSNDVLFLLNEGSGVVRVANHFQYDGLLIATQDSRTTTVDAALTVRSTTSGTPAAGIGTGMLFQAESADESPCDVGQAEFGTTDVSAGTEDTYFQILLRVAGAALTACWRFAATGAFKAILTHANTADRTYTFPNASMIMDGGMIYKGPASIASGSSRSQETFTSATGNLSGIHFYSGDVTLNNGHTLTVPAGKKRLIIVATGTITINGTITASGAGGAAGGIGIDGEHGTDQCGGAGGADTVTPRNGSSGGSVVHSGCIVLAAPTGGAGSGGSATQVTGSDLGGIVVAPWLAMGGGGGGGAGNNNGGAGGGSIVLVAPAVVIGSTGVLNTSGVGTNYVAYGGGGGGAGNVYIVTRSYTDNGGTFTLTGGAADTGTNTNGGAGANGQKQILIYG